MHPLFHLFYAEPALDSVSAAEALIAGERSIPPRGHLLGRFRSFQAGMTDNCPDLSADDPQATRPDNAWPYGLPAEFDGSVYSFRAHRDLLKQGPFARFPKTETEARAVSRSYNQRIQTQFRIVFPAGRRF